MPLAYNLETQPGFADLFGRGYGASYSYRPPGAPLGLVLGATLTTRPVHEPLTDAAILLMTPREVLELYYTRPKYITRGGCPMFEPHPVWSAGLHPKTAEGLEYQIRRRIYKLRQDLWWVTVDGKRVRGLVPLPDDPPVCPKSGASQVAGYFFAVVLAAFPPMWPVIVAQLAQSAFEMTKAIEDAKKMASILRQAQRGIAGIIQNDNLKLAEAYGLFPNNPISYAEAVTIPTSRAAWKLAIALGLPHPAVLLAVDAPRTVANQMAELKRFLIRVHLVRRWILQIRLEEALRDKIEWVEWDIVSLPERSPDVVKIDKSYFLGGPLGIVPRVLTAAQIGKLQGWGGRPDDGLYLMKVATAESPAQWPWLTHRLIKLNGGAEFAVIREYLAWLENPNLYDPAVTAWLKAALADPSPETFISDVPPVDVINDILTPGTTMPARGSYSPAGYVNPAPAGIGPGALLNQFTDTLLTGRAPSVTGGGAGVGGSALLILLAALGLWWLSEKEKA